MRLFILKVKRALGMKLKLSEYMELGYEEATKYGAKKGIGRVYEYKDGTPQFCAYGFAGVGMKGYDEMTKDTPSVYELNKKVFGVPEPKFETVNCFRRKTDIEDMSNGTYLSNAIFDANDYAGKSVPEIADALRSCGL